ncbi:hypothetical protein BGZ96_011653 [Linnemannia gamsii]|uniref:Peptidase metallopeptidase domain-containing protein n=1 Tax=Linnemannia gamsii TaxID=64522 RepID=A0ABQ7KB36_9FUNG|nr:hypothetical protein BGZ96_011653 [Linnemannia gamsii]
MTTIMHKGGHVCPYHSHSFGPYKRNDRSSSTRNGHLSKKQSFSSHKTVRNIHNREGSYPVHHYKGGHECVTDSIGLATPKGRSLTDLRVDASQGIIPLWDVNVTLYYRFQERTLQLTDDPEGTKATLRRLLSLALDAWGNAAPVRFKENDDVWDFEIAVRNADEGGILARSFFPDAGRHELLVYPAIFDQTEKEQIDTFIHELGHVFGLRHFFAAISEKAFPSVRWGSHSKFSIMNYEDSRTPEEESTLTEDDLSDLSRLYELTWSKQLRQIKGTPIVLFKPFHSYTS